MKGRGVSQNPAGRFETVLLGDEHGVEIKTKVYEDHSKSIISMNESPDLPFRAGINVYRGCEHGCVYCFARPYHEYLGMSAGLDFESKIFAKYKAPQLLREKFASKSWKPQVVMMSGITDPFQPVERKLNITREVLKVFAEYRNPVGIITKNNLVTRDLDLLQELAQYNAVHVTLSVTTLDKKLSSIMEPRTSHPMLRIKTIEKLANAGVPVGVSTGPVIPGLNDHEIPNILKAVSEAGGQSAFYTMIRLPYGVKELFTQWLETNFPDRKMKVLNRIQDVKGGTLNRVAWGKRMEGQGKFADQIQQLFSLYKEKYGLNKSVILSIDSFQKITPGQFRLFD